MVKRQRGANQLTDLLFFDTDCLSAFLWVGKESLLTRLYPGRVVIPEQVYDELSYPGLPSFNITIDTLFAQKQVVIEAIKAGTEAYDLYYTLSRVPSKGHVVIGKGEAACIALAKTTGGIVASNNLKDISSYIEEFGLKHVTTGDILVEAYEGKHITEDEGNTIWAGMRRKGRKIGAETFSEYLVSKYT